MGTIIYARIQWFLKLCGLHPYIMYGFRKDRSPLGSVIDLTTSVEQYMSSRRYTAPVFLDVEGAFDFVSHDAILSAF